MSRVPGWGMAKGMLHTFVRMVQPKKTIQYPEEHQDISPHHRGRLILLYDEAGNLKCETCFQCAQACPIEIIDMGGVDTKNRFHVHWGPAEQYAERREESALRRSGRPVADRTFEPWLPVDLGTARADPCRERLRPAPAADDPRTRSGAVRLPAGRRSSAHQPLDRRLVQRDLRHRDVVFEHDLRARPGLRDRPVPVPDVRDARRGPYPRRARAASSARTSAGSLPMARCASSRPIVAARATTSRS